MKPKNNNNMETAEAAPKAAETAKLGGQSEEEWLAIRKKAGRKINPETAEVMWRYGYALDPYGIGSRFSSAFQQLQRNYFARSPGSDIWVFFTICQPLLGMLCGKSTERRSRFDSRTHSRMHPTKKPERYSGSNERSCSER